MGTARVQKGEPQREGPQVSDQQRAGADCKESG
jgi:hypothetical protein